MSVKSFRPMGAYNITKDWTKIFFPILGNPKYDGIRCRIVNGEALSRSLKPIRNVYVQDYLRGLPDLDGELIIGTPFDTSDEDRVYDRTQSGIMSINGMPDFTYYVFDSPTAPGGYLDRMNRVRDIIPNVPQWERMTVVEPVILHNMDELLSYEKEMVDLGHEGVMLRRPDGEYKPGKSTLSEGYLIKLKRFTDQEAVVVDVIEENHNGNEATVSELGLTKRSKVKANMSGKGTMGSCIMRMPSGITFGLGSGFSASQRKKYWNEKPIGRLFKYKCKGFTADGKPRHPTFLGERDEDDLDDVAED